MISYASVNSRRVSFRLLFASIAVHFWLCVNCALHRFFVRRETLLPSALNGAHLRGQRSWRNTHIGVFSTSFGLRILLQRVTEVTPYRNSDSHHKSVYKR